MKEMKRILSIFLCLVMLVGVLPAGALATEDVTDGFVVPGSDKAATDSTDFSGGFVIPGSGKVNAEETTAPSEEETTAPSEEEPAAPETEAAEEVSDEAEQLEAGESVVVIAGSDYQSSSSATYMKNIVAQMGFDTIDGVLMGGDYNGGSTTWSSANEVKAVDTALTNAGVSTSAERIFVQGNHDYQLDPSSSTNLLAAEGEHDTDYYGVYVINQEDFPWSGSSSNLVGGTASLLSDYLDAKVAANYKKPIFVVTHLPLHVTSRGDNKYAKLIFDELEAAGEDGLNIIFMFGHNHSGGYDAYLGNGSIYLPKGSSLTVVDGSSGTYTDSSISFTYMNYGYLGNIAGSSCTHQTMTAFEITDTQVTVKRYDVDSQHLLKEKGATVSGYNTDANDYGQAVINLATGLSTISEIGTDTGSGDSGSGDSGSTGGSGNIYTLVDTIEAGQEYLIVSTNSGTGYALTNPGGSADGAAMGATSVTIENGTIVTDATDVIWTVTANGSRYNLTNGTDYLEGKSGDVAIYSTQQYTDRGWNYEGNQLKHTGGNNTYIVYYDGGFTATYGSSSSTVYFFQRTGGTGGSTGGGSTVTPSGGDWETISDGKGKIVYKLDTDGVDAGSKYLIVSDDEAVAMSAAANSNNSVSIEFNSDETEAYPTSTDYEWTIATSGSGYKMYNADGDYIGRSSSSISNDNSDVWTITGNGEGAYTIKTGSYVLRYSGSNSAFRVGSSNTYSYAVRLYKYDHTDTSTAEYAKIDGELTYTVARGADRDAALAAVMNGIDVLTSANADGSNPTTLDDDDENITWTLDSSYGEGTEPGEYAVTIKYKGVTLGVAKVTVPEATILGYSLESYEGSVHKGASKRAETGAYILVDVKDDEGEDYRVPVTVGMLSGDFTTSVMETYPGLTVTYNGQTWENFTLTVTAKAGNQYPTYPDPGAVQVKKNATGIDFQASGTATVELSVSGIPMNEGVDVVIILDTSSSMTSHKKFEDENGNEVYRIQLLRPAVDELIQQLQTKREDGSNPDIDIAIASFNGNTLSKSGNFINSNYSTSAPTASTSTTNYGVLTGNKTIAGAWEKIYNLSSTWATDGVVYNSSGTATNEGNIPTGSGTNYDYGLQLAYDLLAQKQADNASERKQFVLFLSDGAPSQYNGVWSNDGIYEFKHWFRGNLTDEELEGIESITDKNKTFYTGYTENKGQLHRSAEAIKAAPGQSCSIIRFDSDSTGQLESVDGLGATVYSIGLLLESSDTTSDPDRSEDDQITVLKTIASDESKFFNIDSVVDLKGAFTTFATDVLLAATNARFVDEMGEMYDLQLTPIEYLPTGETTNYSTINPVLEVRSYDIYTRAEYEAGDFTDVNKIGDRKGTFEPLEKITFAYETDENGDYVLTGATSDQVYTEDDAGNKTYTNILNDGVICGKYFWYNTNKNANANDTSGNRTLDLDGDGAADDVLTAETFYWNIGDIKTTELALRYNVHLTGSLEGDRPEGSYDTNGDAILYYNNYQDLPSVKEAQTPTLAWQGANVSYAFYLVDASSGKPVNNDGVEVPFSNRTIIVDTTFYDEVNLFSDGQVESMSIAAQGVLPAGYWLYDEAANYEVEVNGNGTGSWTISGDNTLDNTKTTYVTDYLGSEYTNENSDSTSHPDHDYTHTTVWFAVKWEPQAVPDTVVVDFGLPVDVHVLTNDMFGKYGKLVGVEHGMRAQPGEGQKGETFTSDGPVAGTFGTAEVIAPATGYTEANSVIRYTMDDMGMNSYDQFTYCVQYANPVVSENNGSYYGYLTVIPATTIYYEDDFVHLSSETWNNGWVENGVSGWTIPETTDATQDEDRPDDVNYAFDTAIDANNVYGYDSAYAECSTYSLDSAAKATVDYDHRAKASFTFWGTGFDVISLTSDQTGTIIVNVTGVNEGNTYARSFVVDTYYGYVPTYYNVTYTYQKGHWNPTSEVQTETMGEVNAAPENAKQDDTYTTAVIKWVPADGTDGGNALYQVPVIKTSGLTYGQYDVEIIAQYSEALDANEDGSYDFYLDAIRVYDPAGSANQVVDQDKDGNDITIGDIYEQDEEAYPVYQELRNCILEWDGKEGFAADMAGLVFIDGIGETASVADYAEYGPNNELYLQPGQAIIFTTNLDAFLNVDKDSGKTALASLQIGLKAATATAPTYYIFDAATVKESADINNLKAVTTATATDMYYDITDLAGKNIVIYNHSGGVLSITNLKATFTADSELEEILSTVDSADVQNLLNALNDATAASNNGSVILEDVIRKIVGRLKGLFGNKG